MDNDCHSKMFNSKCLIVKSLFKELFFQKELFSQSTLIKMAYQQLEAFFRRGIQFQSFSQMIGEVKLKHWKRITWLVTRETIICCIL